MKDLVWELFLFVRELMPPSEANSKRQQEWAARFHELEVLADRHEVVNTADHDEMIEDEAPRPDEDPHEHGVPHRSRVPARKKR